MADFGAYLVIRSHAPDAAFREFRDAVSARYPLEGTARLHEVSLLEPGSVAAHTMVVAFADREAARAAYTEMPVGLIGQHSPPLVLLTGAVPPDGLPDPAIPTRANVTPVKADGPVLMIIEGTASDEDRMERYRNILLPMMFDLGSYYVVFDLGGSVEVLAGAWDEAIFAISRWPSRSAAESFWLSSRYQNDAIPLRLSVGRFEVALIPETPAEMKDLLP